ncbi:hypothetical protein ACFLRF_06425 [Candidatus Altiarchaeota archaeon]
MFTIAVKQRKPHVVVHLGDIGEFEKGEVPLEKTEAYVKRFPGIEFIGIDLMRLEEKPDRPNWRHIEADFADGLSQLPDNSVDLISSDMAFGFHDEMGMVDKRRIMMRDFFHDNFWEHTVETARQAHDKLKPGGKFLAAVQEKDSERIAGMLGKVGFGKVETREFTEKDYERTYWTKNYRRHGVKLSQITAVK